MKVRFDQLLREVTDKHQGVFGINEVVELIEKIKVEHDEDLYYENVFPGYFYITNTLYIHLIILIFFHSEIDVVKEASKLYLSMLQEKVADFCSTASYSPEAIDLYYKIRELETKLNVKNSSKLRKSRTHSDARMYSLLFSFLCLYLFIVIYLFIFNNKM